MYKYLLICSLAGLFLFSCGLVHDKPQEATRMYWIREDLQLPRRDLRCALTQDPAGTAQTVIANLNFRPDPFSLKIDSVGRKIYMIDGDGWDKILRANLDGTVLETIVNGTDIYSLCLDAARNRLYWIETDKIRRGNLDGSGAEDVFEHPDNALISWLAIDLQKNQLYFSTGIHISRINSDGTELTTIFDSSVQRGLEFDSRNRRLVWVPDLAIQGFRQSDPDGHNPVIVNIGENPNKGFTLDPSGSIFFVGFGPIADTINRCDQDGTGKTTLYTEEGDFNIYGVALLF
ncbi:MAG TPA: hypothetical protein ENN69_02440 [Spirochaetia bacterium]|nr:hypothetical protein [Spirochaetia bacterium]